MSRLQVLPQELADHIIDQVVASDKNWKPTLRACSIVSKAFHPQARRHLFSHIEFLADRWANKRAGRLIKVITSDTNRHLLASIHSITLVLEIHSGYVHPRRRSLLYISSPLRSIIDNVYRKITEVWRNAARKIELRHHHMVQLLELFIQLPIRSLALHGCESYINWIEFSTTHYEADFAGLVYRMACNPALTTLSFKGIDQAPIYFITGPPHLRKLLLYNVPNLFLSAAPRYQDPGPLSRYFFNVTTLQITNSSVLFKLPPLFLPSYFPYLTTLIVSLPRTPFDNSMLPFILGTSHSLESLELHDMNDRDYAVASVSWGEHCLSRFTALRQLKFKARCHPLDTMHEELVLLVSFLASATSPIPLDSITIVLCIDWRWRAVPVLWDSTPFSPTSDEKWMALDSAFSNPAFVHLSQVTLIFKLFNDDELQAPIPAAQDLQAHLPTLCASSSIQFQTIVETDSFSNWIRPHWSII